jgi:hypothetical protein
MVFSSALVAYNIWTCDSSMILQILSNLTRVERLDAWDVLSFLADHDKPQLLRVEAGGVCGVVWCGVVWGGVDWCGVVWSGVVWCGVVWCGVVWCGVVWCGVVWCGVGTAGLS